MKIEAILSEADWLRRLAGGLVDDDATANDVVQRTMLQALRQDPDSPVRTRSWLGQVARNFVFEDRRRAQRRAVREAAAARPERQPSASEIVQRVESQRAIAEAVLELAPAYRSVIVLHYFDGLSLREIATRTDMPIETVRTRHKRALAQLRVVLDRRFGSRAAWALPLVHPRVLQLRMAARPQLRKLVPRMAGVAAIAAVGMVALRITDGAPPNPPRLTSPPALASEVATRVAAERDAATPGTPILGRAPLESIEVARAQITVEGRIVDALRREAIADAIVSLQRRGAAAWLTITNASTSTTGAFTHEATVPTHGGRYRVLVTAPDFAAHTQDFSVAGWRAPAPRRIELGTFELAVGTHISGRILTASGTAPGATNVFVLRENGELLQLGATETDGRFAAGRAVAPAADADRLFAIGPAGIGWTWLNLARDDQRTDVTLRLFPKAGITVRLVDAAARPVAGAQVSWSIVPPMTQAHWIATALGRGTPFERRIRRTSDASGRVAFSNLPILGHQAANFIVHVADRARYATANVRAEISGSKEIIVRLDPAVPLAVQGTVRDSDRVPANGAQVALRSTNGTVIATTRTDRDGRFRIQARSSDRSTLRVEATTTGARASGDVGDRSVVDLELQSIRWVHGSVIDLSGEGIAGVEIRCGRHTTTSDVNGRFRVPRPASESTLLEFVPPPPSYAWQTPERARIGDRDDLRIKLVRTPAVARLHATVTDSTGRRLDLRRVLLMRLDRNSDREAHPARFGIGWIEADRLTEGRWAVVATVAGGQTIPHAFVVDAEDELVDVNIEPTPTCSIVGELDLSALPAAARDRPITLVHSFIETPALWVDPETGGPLPQGAQVLGTANALRLESGVTRFRLDGLSTFRPAIQIFVNDSGPLVGGREVSLQADRRIRVRIPVRQGTEVRFTVSGRVPAEGGWVWYRSPLDTPDGRRWDDWVLAGSFPPAMTEGIASLAPLTLRPGAYEWAVSAPMPGLVSGHAWLAAPPEFVPQTSGAFAVGGPGSLDVPIAWR